MRNDVRGIPVWFVLLVALWVTAASLVIAFVLFFNAPEEAGAEATGNAPGVEGEEAPEASDEQEQANRQEGQEGGQGDAQQAGAEQADPQQAASAESGGGDVVEAGAAAEAWYTQEQADRGQEAYAENCVSCHGEDLQGRAGQPALAGEAFLANWETVGELYDFTRESMPQVDPGSLEDQTYADILAYVLRVNGFPSGDEELPADSDALADMTLRAGAAQ